jgi:hypothetical protein
VTRIAECDYDKPARCPGWSGAGWTFNKRDWCDGAISPRWVNERDRDFAGLWWLRIRKTNCCGTYVLPHVFVWLNWRTWKPSRIVKGSWYWYPGYRIANIPIAFRMWRIKHAAVSSGVSDQEGDSRG